MPDKLANRPRTVPAIMKAVPGHSGPVDAITMNETAVHTITLPEGHFACIVQTNPALGYGAITILDRAEVEAHIQLLRNAMDDAERLDRGEAPVNVAPTMTRQ